MQLIRMITLACLAGIFTGGLVWMSFEVYRVFSKIRQQANRNLELQEDQDALLNQAQKSQQTNREAP